ncbi:MAG: hypothetical protein V3T14_11990 [Myxococcota bacterium]
MEWQPDAGYSVVAGTESPFPNGIEVSPDVSVIYLNTYLGHDHRAIERATGKRIFTVEIEMPDNMTWASDGRLLIASKPESLSESLTCSQLEAGSCAVPFQIIAVDPKTGTSEVLVSADGTPMGLGTVGLQVGHDLWIGTWAGDRIARVSLED